MKHKLNMSLIDYVWYVGERFHQREQSPGDGNMLIAICWYCTFFLPLLSVVNKLKISLVLQLLGSIVLIIVPFVFCHIRYNQKNKYLIGLQYKNKKHWGRRLLIIWSFLLAVIIMEFIVMIKIGFWHIGA
ncbi:hypothetical protein [Bilophila sp.]|uniref:hypothetical protein n=1 Tax=Bilophila sp. TaxID=1929485 RepID=UPI003076A9AC